MKTSSSWSIVIAGKQYHELAIITVSAIFGAVYIYWLSGYMFVVPGSIITTKADLAFNSDMPFWIERVQTPFWSENSISHPLRPFTWAYLARFAGSLFGIVLDPVSAATVAVKLLNAVMLGIAYGWFAWFCRTLGLEQRTILLLTLCFALFSTNAVVALPDHFGISMALCITSFAVLFLPISFARKLWIEAGLSLVIGGTTITNVLLPVLAIGYLIQTSGNGLLPLFWRLKWIVLSLAIVLLLGGAALLYDKWDRIAGGQSLTVVYMHLRLLKDPISALQYALAAVVYPVVAPMPAIVEQRLTLEPIRFSQLDPAYVASAIAWLIVLQNVLRASLAGTARGAVVFVLAPWFLFNTIFHNLWGDEFFLFSPHWAWCFAILLALGMKNTSPYVFLLLPVMAIGQVRFLLAVHAALGSF